MTARHRDVVAGVKEKVLAWKKTLPKGPVETPHIGKGKPRPSKAKPRAGKNRN